MKEIKKPIKILLEGHFFIISSMSQINRDLANRIKNVCDYDIRIHTDEEMFDVKNRIINKDSDYIDLSQKQFNELQCLMEGYASKDDFDYTIMHKWPPVFKPPQKGYYIVMAPWEFGSLPIEWIKPFNNVADDIWVYSYYLKQTYVENGIDPDRISVIHPYVDSNVFKENGPKYEIHTKKKFKFLFVGGSIPRKGIDNLLNAYLNEFTKKDDVCLVIKDVCTNTFYKTLNISENIKKLSRRSDLAEIKYIESNFRKTSDMATLYRSCDCIVHPYKAEGFALPIAEALACAKPVIVTGAGACLDYCSHENAYLIKSHIEKFGEKKVGEEQTLDYPFWAEVDIHDLKLKLREVYNHYGQAKEKALIGQKNIVKNFSIDNTIGQILKSFKKLKCRKVIRYKDRSSKKSKDEEKYYEAIALLKDNKKKNAKKILLDIIQENPAHKNAIKTLSEIYMQNHQNERAIRLLAVFLQKNPMDFEILNLLGTYLDKIEELVLAKAFFKKSLAVCPDNEIVANNLKILGKKMEVRKGKRIAARYLYLQKISQKEDPKHTIALCMIIKNEEKNLGECLESVKGLVDEIIIVDTGSTDKSVEIAKKHGAEVRHFKWNDDFAAARNVSIKEIAADWILYMDADEILVDAENRLLSDLPDKSEPFAYYVKIKNILDKNSEDHYLEHYALRLFKNNVGIQFSGKIHEQLISSQAEIKTELSDILIKHIGYQKEEVDTKHKNNRNLQLLKASVQKEPDHPFPHYNLGVHYYSISDYAQAIKCFRNAIAKHKNHISSFLHYCYSYIANASYPLGDYQQTIACSLKALEIVPDFPDAYYSLANGYLKIKKYEKAAENFKKAMACKNTVFLGGSIDSGIIGWKSLNGLGSCCMKLKDYEGAIEKLEEAHKIEKRSPEVIMNLIHAYHNIGLHEKIETLLSKIDGIALSISFAQNIVNILLCANRQAAALTLIQKMRKTYEDNKIIYDEDQNHFSLLLRGEADIYFEIKDYQRAKTCFKDYIRCVDEQTLSKDKKSHQDALKKYGLCLFYLNDKTKAISILEEALKMDRALEDYDWELYFSYGTLKMDTGEYEEAVPYFQEAIAFNKDAHTPYIALAQIYLKMKKYDLAEEVCSKAITLEMHQRDEQILYLKSKACSLQSKYEQAIDALVFMIESGKESAEAYHELGLCLSKLNEHDQSIDFFLKAIEKDNKIAQYYANLGNALLETKKHEDAKTAYTCALEIDANHEAALIGLSMIDVEKKLYQ